MWAEYPGRLVGEGGADASLPSEWLCTAQFPAASVVSELVYLQTGWGQEKLLLNRSSFLKQAAQLWLVVALLKLP